MASNSRMTWTHQQKLEWFQKEFRPHFDEWVIDPAQRMVNAPEAMPAFIWLACAIDWLAGFWWGQSTDGHVKQVYVGFISNFFPQSKYIAEDLYDSLRNGLVHMYTIKGKKYALKHQEPTLHLKVTTDAHVVLNLENFFDDVVKAKNGFFDAVELDPLLLDKVIIRYEREGFLDIISVNIP